MSPIPSELAAPVAIRGSAARRLLPDISPPASNSPPTRSSVSPGKHQQRDSLEHSRMQGYALDYPKTASYSDIQALQMDEASRFFARAKPRTLDMPQLLPYETETPQNQAKYLAHIVSHLYIAVKTLDLQGLLVVSPKDLVALKDTPGFSDVQLALDTGLFQLDSHDQEEAIEDEVDDDDDDDGEVSLTSTAVVGSPKSSAVVSVRHWTNELNVWMKMKFDMPVQLRIALARVYYAICLSRGQSLSLQTFLNMFNQLVKDKPLMKKHGLRLAWRPLFKEFENEFPKYDALVDDIETKSHNDMLTLALNANQFFDPAATEEIIKEVLSRFSLLTASLTISTLYALLPCTFNAGSDVRDYLPSIFNIWATTVKTKGIDGHLSGLLGRLAEQYIRYLANEVEYASAEENKERLSIYGVFSQAQFSSITNVLLNSLNINPEMLNPYPSSNVYHGYAACIVFSMNGDAALVPDGIMDQVALLVNAIATYIHPSNAGAWTGSITKVIDSLIYQYHKRLNQEKTSLQGLPEAVKLSPAVTKQFVKIMLPVVITGIQSKKDSVINTFVHSLSLLAYLNPEYVLDTALLDIYESLEGVISSHRVHSAMKVLAALVRYMASTPVYRVHVTRVLTMVIPGIDSNDLFKTLYTLNIFTAASSFIPFSDLSDGNLDTGIAMQFIQQHLEYLEILKIHDGDEAALSAYGISLERFFYEPEFELEALKSSSVAFNEVIRLFFGRMYILLENLTDPSKTKGGLEKAVLMALPKCVNQIFEAMPGSYFAKIADEFFAYSKDSLHHSTAEATASISGFIVKRDPAFFKKYMEYLIPRIREEIKEGAGAQRTGSEIVPRDEPLFCNLLVLNSCVEYGGVQILDYQTELVALVTHLMQNVKGPSVYISTYLIHQILHSVSTIRLAETRLISPSYTLKHGITAECWGGFQFSDERFSKLNLTFEWHIPNGAEITFAVDAFEKIVNEALGNLSALMKLTPTKEAGKPRNLLDFTDDFRHNLLCISHALSGVAQLLDPLYDAKVPKHRQSSHGGLQSRLMVLRQIRASSGGASTPTPQEWLFDDSVINTPTTIPNDNVLLDQNDDDDDDIGGEDLRFGAEVPMTSEPTPSATSPPTPGIDGDADNMTLMNPTFTSRDSKLYSSNYFFGQESDDRLGHPLYRKIHQLRAKVGKHLEDICTFLIDNHENDITLFKIFLHSLTTWFYDVGFDTSHEQKTASYRYLYTIQHINRVRKPFTRSGFGARLELYHRQRAIIHASSRVATDLDKKLIAKTAELCNSVYIDISRSAQVAMSRIMKKVLGSYSLFMKVTFKHMVESLIANDHNKIESGLRSFAHRGVKRKISADFNNINEYASILLRCMNVDNVRVSDIAQKLYKSFSKHLRIPSSICLIDLDEVDIIKPRDDLIEVEVRAVRIAKESKRDAYFKKLTTLEHTIVDVQRNTKHWKSKLLNVNLLCSIQQDLEVASNYDVMEILMKESTNLHPDISRASVKGLNSLLTKFEDLSAYNYDLGKLADLGHFPDDVLTVSTKGQPGKSFTSTLQKELHNQTDPSFYFDNKLSTGWLFWGDELTVVKPQAFYQLALNEHDEHVLKSFCKLITKDWLTKLIGVVIEENEERATFQGTDVFLFRVVIQLISAGYVESLKFVDLIDIVNEKYSRDEKNVHVVICELCAGFLIASKYTAVEFVDMRDEFLSTTLTRVLEDDLSPENKGVWNILCWWVPSHCDIRRYPKTAHLLTSFKLDKTSDAAFIESTRLSYLKSFVNSITWKYVGADTLLKNCFENIDHPYQAVREQVAKLVTVLIYTHFNTSYSCLQQYVSANNAAGDLGCEPFLLGQSSHNFIVKSFEQTEQWRAETEGMSPQAVMNSRYFRASRTLLCMIKQISLTSSSIVLERYLVDYLWPFLMHLSGFKDVCKLANINPPRVFLKLAQLPYRASMLEGIITNVEATVSAENPSKRSLMIVSAFIQIFYFKNFFLLSQPQKQKIFNMISKLCFAKILEVRESAASTLSGMVHLSDSQKDDDFVSQVLHRCTQILMQKNRGKISNEESVSLHGATLGLGSLINAFPYASPPPKWVPRALASLAKYASGVQGVVGRTAKETLSNFKKTRQDTWEVDSKSFTSEQLEDLEGVLWKSYFI
ncbi:hypothetical protein BABINDRAFT_172415 [Babjeviella inositovora NRRL Y-12698]|uniref:Proteasome activator Blm10 mid region domain-containing protein n=1 Tax=Babjeviella inositovora NRRL Y-12698 TaxID=984486 RepID=A0A1E3QKT1_9ASCO|nr:uncharacterized protein BABINDRAFT_172415 [Babjeviella inositovora NRRL Y-12698]ODQ78309.1 hypothetical protein BABINDRAFT_172415 [Babjeviella inositovora NRRL Y-12698]